VISRTLSPTGAAFIAAKRYYFGTGGGTTTLLSLVKVCDDTDGRRRWEWRSWVCLVKSVFVCLFLLCWTTESLSNHRIGPKPGLREPRCTSTRTANPISAKLSFFRQRRPRGDPGPGSKGRKRWLAVGAPGRGGSAALQSRRRERSRPGWVCYCSQPSTFCPHNPSIVPLISKGAISTAGPQESTRPASGMRGPS
jgi:hypothetical protein